MNDSRSRIEVLYSRIRNHPIVAPLIVVGTLVIALSTFTDAARNLMDLAWPEARPRINGEWRATVTYDWSPRPHAEAFTFTGEGMEVHGTASFLGTKRGILEGRIEHETVEFLTRTREELGAGESSAATHEYRGTVLGDEIRFTMQTRGGYSDHPPIEFTAKKATRGER